MCPKILEIGGIPVYGYGLMLALGFIVASSLLSAELKRKTMNVDVTGPFLFVMRRLFIALGVTFLITYSFQYSPGSLFEFAMRSTVHVVASVAVILVGVFLFRKQPNNAFDLANAVTLLALTFGVVGSKALYLIEHLKDFGSRPFDTAFSPGGLTFYGGFLLATGAIYFTARRSGISFLAIADSASPALILGYGIARIGCHLAGDGDYGFPTSLPWGTDYSKGTFPPSEAFKSFPEIASRYPNSIVPDTTLCHPTPVYELILCTVIFAFLWRTRLRPATNGMLFVIYLTLAGLERFLIEFMRINPRLLFGFSEAQLIALVLFLAGTAGWYRLARQQGVS